jgi:Fic family protein
MKNPPFELTLKILKLCSDIQEIIGEFKTTSHSKPSVKLRKENKIKTVHHSLAIEGNTLTESQVTALLENKRVSGPKKQIQEVVNALELYDQISSLDPLKEKDLLKAHSILMRDLIERPGKYRQSNVGIMKGKTISHIAPQAKMVPALMKSLFAFLKGNKEIPMLIKACVFHYELEFIHPFEDGNGRMGRLWQQSILMKHSSILEYVSVETLIHKRQKDYDKTLEACDKAGNSTQFIEFCLELILESLNSLQNIYRPQKITGPERVAAALNSLKNGFSRKDYLDFHKDISTATGSRDLADAVKEGILKRIGDKALAIYKKN